MFAELLDCLQVLLEVVVEVESAPFPQPGYAGLAHAELLLQQPVVLRQVGVDGSVGMMAIGDFSRVNDDRVKMNHNHHVAE